MYKLKQITKKSKVKTNGLRLFARANTSSCSKKKSCQKKLNGKRNNKIEKNKNSQRANVNLDVRYHRPSPLDVAPSKWAVVFLLQNQWSEIKSRSHLGTRVRFGSGWGRTAPQDHWLYYRLLEKRFDSGCYLNRLWWLEFGSLFFY